jgi:hypothetical protein
MFQGITEVLYELGFYHTITDKELIKDLKKTNDEFKYQISK